MDDYQSFWNWLIFGKDGVGVDSIERYWVTLGVCAAAFFALGTFAIRSRFASILITVALTFLYFVAMGPLIGSAVACTDCHVSYGGSRSSSLATSQLFWGSVFSLAVATFWLGAVTSIIVRGLGSYIGVRRGEDDDDED